MQEKNQGKQKDLDKNQANKNFDVDLQLRLLEALSDNFDETIVFNEVKQKLGLQDIDTMSETYQDLIHYLRNLLPYPSTGRALFHRQSNRLGTLDVEKNSQWIKESKGQKYKLVTKKQFCRCCGLPKQDQQLQICNSSFNHVASTGISIFMFYRTMINLISLLSLALLIFGIYALTTNIMIFEIVKHRLEDSNVYLMISSGDKIVLGNDNYVGQVYQPLPELYKIVQAWLGEAMVVAFLLAYFLMQKIQITQVNQVEALNKSASDFTVVFKGVPMNVTKNEIQLAILSRLNKAQNGFSTSEMNDFAKKFREDSLIAKINVAVPRHHKFMQSIKLSKEKIRKIIQKENEFKKKVVGWIMQLAKAPQFETSQQSRQRIEKDFNAFRKQKKIQNNSLVFSIFSLASNISSKIIGGTLRMKCLNTEGIEKLKIQNEISKHEKMAEVAKTDVFVTFQSRKIKEQFLNSIRESVFQRIRSQVTLHMQKKKIPLAFNGLQYRVRIQQASQPEDILWDNIGVKRKEIYLRKFIIFGITFLILGASFVTVYALSTVQYDNKENQYISFLISLVIPIFNFIILCALEYLTKLELDMTHTAYQSSLAVKTIIAQLVNTILIPILVNQFVKINNKYYGKGGIDEEIFYIGITNSFLPPIIKIIDPKYIYFKYVRVWWYERPGKKFYLTQRQLNQVYELMQFQNGIEYVYIITLYLFTCFYMSLQPIIIIFAICGYVLNYWGQKNYLFHRCKRPVPGTRILYHTMVQFIYAGGLFYSMGSLFFMNLMMRNMFEYSMSSDLIANLIAIGVSVFSLFTPFSSFHNSLINRKAYTGNQLFSQDRVFLPSEYDRINPATKKMALKEYHSFIENARQQLSKKSAEQKMIFEQILQRQDRYIPVQHNQNPDLERFSDVSNVPHKLVSKYLLGDEDSIDVRSDRIQEGENERMEFEYEQGGKGIDVSQLLFSLSNIVQKQSPQVPKSPLMQLQQSSHTLPNLHE